MIPSNTRFRRTHAPTDGWRDKHEFVGPFRLKPKVKKCANTAAGMSKINMEILAT